MGVLDDHGHRIPLPVPMQPLLRPPPALRPTARQRVPQTDEGGGGVETAAAIERLLSVLGALDPAEAAVVRGTLPRADSTFGLGLALFLAATAEGGRGWLGEAAAGRLDELDGGALLDGLDAVLQPDHRRSADGRHWRVTRVPVFAGEEALSLLCAFGIGEGLEAERFLVLQIRLPTLGVVQIQASCAGRRVDVILQTAEGFSAALQEELHESFAMAVADADLAGGLTLGSTVGSWLDLDGRLSAEASL